MVLSNINEHQRVPGVINLKKVVTYHRGDLSAWQWDTNWKNECKNNSTEYFYKKYLRIITNW